MLKKTLKTLSLAIVFAAALTCVSRAAGKELVLVEDGQSVAPVVLFEGAPPFTKQAAEHLATYIEKVSGARPELIEGAPDPIPDRAIWVGHQPAMDALFPEQNFDFEHPEEILIAANANHLAILGRDRWNPEHMTVEYRRKTVDGVQVEYGTANAVYTFLQDYLDVRWLFPGELGEDIIEQKTIAFEPFTYRYHPQVRSRQALFAYSSFPRRAGDWMRYQRLLLDSFEHIGGGHGFGDWWDRYHEEHPDYFALQPDGTRSGYPEPHNAKLCQSNPAVWEQWLDNVEQQLKQNPNKRVFNASPNDGYHSGHCICEDCRAWDHPDAETRVFKWQGLGQSYVALSDRHITFANHLARGLKERFPDKELYVYMLAYGHSRPAPIEAVPEDNVMIGDVANFLLRTRMKASRNPDSGTHKEYFADWGELTDMHFWRPNVGSPVGWQDGVLEVSFGRTIDNFKFAADNGWMGIYVDYIREHWSTQAPMYYLMAQLTWNPGQDGRAILNDFYQRAYGPAADPMRAYWTALEHNRDSFIDEYGYGNERSISYVQAYTPERLSEAKAHLAKAKKIVEDGPAKYRDRIDWTAAGFEFTELFTECGRLMPRVKREDDAAARQKVLDNWQRIRELQKAYPTALRWRNIFSGGMDADGPPRQFYPN